MSRERWPKKTVLALAAASAAAGLLAGTAEAVTYNPYASVVNPGAVDTAGSPFEYNNRWDAGGSLHELTFMNGTNPDPPNQPGEVLPTVNEVLHLELSGLSPGYSYLVQFDFAPSSSHKINWSFNSAAEAFAGTNSTTTPAGPISVPITETFGTTPVLTGDTIDLYIGGVHSSTLYHYFQLLDIHATQQPPNPNHYYEANAIPGPGAVGPTSISNPEVLGVSGYAYDNLWGDAAFGSGNGGDEIQHAWRSASDPPPGAGEGPLALEDVPHHIFDGLIPGHIYQIRAQVDNIDKTPLTLEYSTQSAAGALAGENSQTSPFPIPIGTEYLFFDDVFAASDLGRIHMLLGEAFGNETYSWIALDYWWLVDLSIVDEANHPAVTPPPDPFPIPEPASLSLLALSGLAMLRRRRA